MFDKARGSFARLPLGWNTRTLIWGGHRVWDVARSIYAQADGWLTQGIRVSGNSGSGLVAARPDSTRHRSLFHVLRRGDDPDLFRGGQVPAAGAIFSRSGMAGSRSTSIGTVDFPDRWLRTEARRPDAARREFEAICGRLRAPGSVAMCRWSVISVADLIRPLFSALQPTAARGDSRLHVGLDGPGPTSARKRAEAARDAGVASFHDDRRSIRDRLGLYPSWCGPPSARCLTHPARPVAPRGVGASAGIQGLS